eukprot:COSAG06_NODE_65409_length_257_cov_0.639241_1_plen_28_part_10
MVWRESGAPHRSDTQLPRPPLVNRMANR